MNEKFPRVTAEEVIRVLERIGFRSLAKAEAIRSTESGRQAGYCTLPCGEDFASQSFEEHFEGCRPHSRAVQGIAPIACMYGDDEWRFQRRLPLQIRGRGIEVLAKALGPVGMARFL